jgi:hypothetical protein
MRFSFGRKSNAPRWVDSAALGWVPEKPLDFTPKFDADPAPTWTDEDTAPEPKADVPTAPALFVVPEPAEAAELIAEPEAVVAGPEAAPEMPEPVVIEDVAAPETSVTAQKITVAPPLPHPANSNAAPNLLLPRLVIGLAQGAALFALAQSRDLGLWPGSDPYLFAAFSLALLFAPLVLLEGLGEIEIRLLGLWTGTVACALASLGLYHHWRSQALDTPHSGLALVILAALMLVIAQALFRAALRDGKPLARYATYSDTTWTLAGRLVVWALLAGTAWAIFGSGNSLFNWLRAHYPALRLSIDPQVVILPLVGAASAAAFDITNAQSFTRRAARKILLTCCTVALPMLVALCAATLAAHIAVAPLSLAVALAFALLLVIAANASYRDGASRGMVRRISEFLAAFLILGLVTAAAFALGARVAAFGWSAGRVYAAAGTIALGLYGAAYAGAGLISIGGGKWMQKIEGANIALALMLMAAALALATPLTDPLQLAVKAQANRLERIDPALFDFAWLRRAGRFGTEALAAMTRSSNPQVARLATETLAAPPGAEVPPPSQIGANIAVRTPGARLPNALLQQDWTANPAAPPCLTKPAMSCDAWFLDLDGDGAREILLVYGNDARWWATVMKENRQGWAAAATLHSPACPGTLAAMRAQGVAPINPVSAWRDVLVAGMRLTPMPAPQADLPCPG